MIAVTRRHLAGAAVRRGLGRIQAWAVARWPLLVAVTLTSAASLATLLPHLDRPLVVDETEFIAAAQGIQRYGVPVYYRGWIGLDDMVRVGRVHIAGLPGYSTIFKTPDGFITAVQHGSLIDLVGNWHPELYLYLLALFLRLPVAFEVAARLLNVVCLEASAMLVYGITAQVLRRWGASSRWRWAAPIVVSLAYVLHPFTTRGTVLVDFTGTLSVTTVLLFWFVRLTSAPTWRGLAAQIVAFALVPWSNMGPFPALVVALGAVAALECVRGPRRRGLMSLVVLVGGIGLFYVSFELYSLWAGLPASLTLDHNSARVSEALAQLPYPLAWRYGGASGGSVLLWALAVGPLCGAAVIAHVASRLAVARRVGWSDGRLAAAIAAGGALVSALGIAGFSRWQGIRIRAGFQVTLTSLIALVRFLWAHWLGVANLEWLIALLAVSAAVLAIRLPHGAPMTDATETDPGLTLKEMAFFTLVIGADLLLLGAQAWGFPKYDAPILAVCAPLVAVLVYTITRDRVAPQRVAGVALLALAGGLVVLLFTHVANPYGAPYRFGHIGAIMVLVAAAWACLGLPIVRQIALRAPLQRSARYAAPALLILGLAPLTAATVRDAVSLPSARGSVTYLEGTSWGIRAAGKYLHAHARPGDEVKVRKDVGFYSEVNYGEDFPWTTPLQCVGTRVVWTARTSVPGKGYALMWTGPEYNVYRCVPAAATPPSR